DHEDRDLRLALRGGERGQRRFVLRQVAVVDDEQGRRALLLRGERLVAEVAEARGGGGIELLVARREAMDERDLAADVLALVVVELGGGVDEAVADGDDRPGHRATRARGERRDGLARD